MCFAWRSCLYILSLSLPWIDLKAWPWPGGILCSIDRKK